MFKTYMIAVTDAIKDYGRSTGKQPHINIVYDNFNESFNEIFIQGSKTRMVFFGIFLVLSLSITIIMATQIFQDTTECKIYFKHPP